MKQLYKKVCKNMLSFDYVKMVVYDTNKREFYVDPYITDLDEEEDINDYTFTDNIIHLEDYNIIISDELMEMTENIVLKLKDVSSDDGEHMCLYVTLLSLDRKRFYNFNIILDNKKTINLFDDYEYISNNLMEYLMSSIYTQRIDLNTLMLKNI